MPRLNRISYSSTCGRPLVAIALLFVACSLVGCGKGDRNLVPVAGKVLIDGQPLSRGFVRFVPAKGRVSTGAIQSDGSFTLTCFKTGDGTLAGMNRIEIASTEILSPTQIKWYTPKVYASAATSGLTMDISQPLDNAVIQLNWGNVKGPFVEQLQTGSGT